MTLTNLKSTLMLVVKGAVIGVIIAVVILLWQPRSHLQSFTPYSEFQAMTLEQLKTLQVKLTYVGPQTAPIPTVVFTSSFSKVDLDKFVPFRRPQFDYGNDVEGAVESFVASPTELQAVIANVGMLPTVTGGGVAPRGVLSFALFNSAGRDGAFESVIARNEMTPLFGAISRALEDNKAGHRVVTRMACQLVALEAGRPTDVSPQVTVVFSGVRLDRNTGRFVGTATVRNTSTTSIAGPISLVVVPSSTVTLFNADGTTCGTIPQGRTFINLTVPGNVLNPGERAEVILQFENPDGEPVQVTTKVLAGPGAR